MTKKIYLDYAATRPIRQEVLKEMNRVMTGGFFGNTESIHEYGLQARSLVTEATKQIKFILGASQDSEIIYTSGGTESNMLAFTAAINKPGTILVSAIEHPSVYEYAQKLKQEGKDVRFLNVDSQGIVDLAGFWNTLNTLDNVSFVSVMLVNNELGTIQPVKKIFQSVKEKFPNAICHCDASQAPLFLDVSLSALAADMITFCGHKLYGPKGIGVLYAARADFVTPLYVGGGQQHGLRSGTLPVELIKGFEKAFVLAAKERQTYTEKIKKLETYFLGKTSKLPISKYGSQDRAPVALNLTFNNLDIDSEALVSKLNVAGIAVSSKSACMGSEPGNSYVIDALGVKPKHTIRFSFGRYTTTSDIDYVVSVINKFHQGS